MRRHENPKMVTNLFLVFRRPRSLTLAPIGIGGVDLLDGTGRLFLGELVMAHAVQSSNSHWLVLSIICGLSLCYYLIVMNNWKYLLV